MKKGIDKSKRICYTIKVVSGRHNAGMAQSVEHVIGNDEVISSILITSSKIPNAIAFGILFSFDATVARMAQSVVNSLNSFFKI